MRSRVLVWTISAALFTLGWASPAAAQRKLWGVSLSFAPTWRTLNFSKYVEAGADTLSLQGEVLRLGVSRGGKVQGDWSLLYLQRTLKTGGLIERDGVAYTTMDDVKLHGFEAETFAVKGNIKDRVLIGVVVAGGVATVRGRLASTEGGTIDAKEILTLAGTDVKLQPLFRLELGVGVVVARGFRVRLGGGLDLSGYSGGLTGTYFFGDR
jgi:hypothetical protein